MYRITQGTQLVSCFHIYDPVIIWSQYGLVALEPAEPRATNLVSNIQVYPSTKISSLIKKDNNYQFSVWCSCPQETEK